MDKIARVRQEIERRLNILTNVYAEQVERKDEEMMNYYHGKVIALEELRPFLDTLSEEPDKSLEEAAEELADEHGFIKNPDCKPAKYSWQAVRDVFIEAAKAGAEWQKEQMLKDSVEGYVNYYEDSGGILMAEAQVGCPYHNGDRVRIVVLKEEEK